LQTPPVNGASTPADQRSSIISDARPIRLRPCVAIQARGRRQRARIVDAHIAIKHAVGTSSGQAPAVPPSVTDHTSGGDLALSAFIEKSPAELRAWAGLRFCRVCRRLEVAHRFSQGRIIARALVSGLAHSIIFMRPRNQIAVIPMPHSRIFKSESHFGTH
jgi:hypothetical protein